jgi:site-specific DNA-methyltransferase (adenine-specific)
MKLVIRKKYTLIYADPPWPYSSREGTKVTGRVKITDKYPVLSIRDIASFDIPRICADNVVLVMWTTDAFLEYALLIMKAWGFTYKTVAFWWHKQTVNGKTRTNMGEYTLKCGELCLLGTKGKPKQLIKNRCQRQLIEAVNLGHSQKPIEAIKRLRIMVPGGLALEMFSRKASKGWDVFGNQVANSITIPFRKNINLDFSGMNLCGTENSLPKHLRGV